MPTQFIDALRSEIAGLEAELATDPRFQKLESLRGVLKHYSGEPDAECSNNVPAATEGRTSRLGRRPSDSRHRALQLSEDYLESLPQTVPTPTREIYAAILKQGVEIGGKDPVSNLSAMLSQSDVFNSNGRAGWTLKANVHRVDEPETGENVFEDDEGANPIDPLS